MTTNTTPITIEHHGRRHYIVGAPFSARERLKNAGCKWDPERRAWWSGSAEKAAAVVESLAAAPLMLEGRPVKLADDSWGVRLIGASSVDVGATVKVSTAKGDSWQTTVTAIVESDANGITVKTTERPRAQTSSRSHSDPRRCREHGCSAPAVIRGYCRQCAFDEFDN